MSPTNAKRLPELITPQEAARISGYCAATLRTYAKRGVVQFREVTKPHGVYKTMYFRKDIEWLRDELKLKNKQ